MRINIWRNVNPNFYHNYGRIGLSFLSSRQSKGMSSLSKYHSEEYDRQFKASIENPEEYWGNISKNTVWDKPWTKVLDNSNPPFTKWFVGGKLSLCYNAVDRHVDEGNGDRKALIWDSPISGDKKSFTYKEFQNEVSKLAGVLSQKLGVKKGDRVIIYMPMIPETVIAMMAVGRIGAIHSVVFGGFSAKELSTRIKHSQPKVILTASCGLEAKKIVEYKPIVDAALELAETPDMPVVVYQRSKIVEGYIKPSRDEIWQDVMEGNYRADCVPIDSNDPLYLLYTSGTTGSPKGIVHPAGAHAVVNKWTMETIYGIKPGEVFWAASDLGWIVGHEYICYSPLLNGNSTVIYEGKPVGTPDAGQFFRVISEYNVRGLFLAPTALRAIKKEDPEIKYGKKYNIDNLKYIFVAGEHCDHDTRVWTVNNFKAPVLDNWWQTETAHAISATCVGLGMDVDPPKDVTGKAVPGFDVRVIKEDGSLAATNELGRIVCKLPLAPGTMKTLFNDDHRFVETYFSSYPGYYDTMDAGMIDEHGYIKVLARDDDVINVAGHRLSTSLMEEIVLSHPDISDCTVVGMQDKLKGELPLALYVMEKNANKSASEISVDLINMMRKDVGPVAAFKLSVAISGLPRTRSGKTARKAIADMASGKVIKIPPTIEDPLIFNEIKSVLVKDLKLNVPDPIAN